MDDIKLKNCPFCGCKAIIHINEGVRVVCENCGCGTPTYVDGNFYNGKPKSGALQTIIEKWNRRIENE